MSEGSLIIKICSNCTSFVDITTDIHYKDFKLPEVRNPFFCFECGEHSSRWHPEIKVVNPFLKYHN